jgi:hypothetical protein
MVPHTARGIFTRPPTGTPRRASNPSEGLRLPLLFSLTEGVARLPFIARIERPPLHRGGSASKKGSLAIPSPLLAAPETISLPPSVL